jgi:hypothetical protein
LLCCLPSAHRALQQCEDSICCWVQVDSWSSPLIDKVALGFFTLHCATWPLALVSVAFICATVLNSTAQTHTCINGISCPYASPKAPIRTALGIARPPRRGASVAHWRAAKALRHLVHYVSKAHLAYQVTGFLLCPDRSAHTRAHTHTHTHTHTRTPTYTRARVRVRAWLQSASERGLPGQLQTGRRTLTICGLGGHL